LEIGFGPNSPRPIRPSRTQLARPSWRRRGLVDHGRETRVVKLNPTC
jgi:hypothetical protein